MPRNTRQNIISRSKEQERLINLSALRFTPSDGPPANIDKKQMTHYRIGNRAKQATGKIMEVIRFLILLVIAYVGLGAYATLCSYIVYGDNPLEGNISRNFIIGFISYMLCCVSAGLVLIFAMLPLVCVGERVKHRRKSDPPPQVCSLYFVCFILTCGIYFTGLFCELTIKKPDNTPNLLSNEAFPYAICGVLKTIPGVILLYYAILSDIYSEDQKVHTINTHYHEESEEDEESNIKNKLHNNFPFETIPSVFIEDGKYWVQFPGSDHKYEAKCPMALPVD